MGQFNINQMVINVNQMLATVIPVCSKDSVEIAAHELNALRRFDGKNEYLVFKDFAIICDEMGYQYKWGNVHEYEIFAAMLKYRPVGPFKEGVR